MQEFNTSAVKKDDKLETALKAAYKYKNIQSAATFNNFGKVRTVLQALRGMPNLAIG